MNTAETITDQAIQGTQKACIVGVKFLCMYVLFIDRFQIHDKNIKNIFTLIKENCPQDQMKIECIIQAV